MNFEKLNIVKKLRSVKGKKIIIISGLLGILLIFLSGLTDTTDIHNNEISGSVNDYKMNLQDELKQMLYKIEGVGDVEVLLTIENSVEGVYLENNSTKTMEIEPVIRGVIVACRGGDEPVVTQRVLIAVTKALDVSSAKVCVTKLKD